MEELERLSEDKYFGALYDNTVVQRKLENSAFDLGEQRKEQDIFVHLQNKGYKKEEIIEILNIDEEKYLFLENLNNKK